MSSGHVTVTPDLARFIRSGAGMASGALRRALTKVALRVEGRAKRSVYEGHPDHLEGDTGRLRQSITNDIRYPYARVGSNVVYAAIHEFGGTIRPVKARMLAIPVGDRKGSPRDYQDLHVEKSGDRVWLADERGVPQYSLRRSVTIPARPYLAPALEAVAPEAPEVLRRELLGELEGRGEEAVS